MARSAFLPNPPAPTEKSSYNEYEEYTVTPDKTNFARTGMLLYSPRSMFMRGVSWTTNAFHNAVQSVRGPVMNKISEAMRAAGQYTASAASAATDIVLETVARSVAPGSNRDQIKAAVMAAMAALPVGGAIPPGVSTAIVDVISDSVLGAIQTIKPGAGEGGEVRVGGGVGGMGDYEGSAYDRMLDEIGTMGGYPEGEAAGDAGALTSIAHGARSEAKRQVIEQTMRAIGDLGLKVSGNTPEEKVKSLAAQLKDIHLAGDKKRMESTCVKIARAINNAHGSQIIDVSQPAEMICDDTVGVLTSMSYGMCGEFYAVSANIKRSIHNLGVISRLISDVQRAINDKVAASDATNQLELRNVAGILTSVRIELDRQLAILQSMLNIHLEPGQGELADLIKDLKSLEAFGTSTGGSKSAFERRVVGMLKALNTNAATAILVSKALKPIGMTVQEFESYKNTGDLFLGIAEKMDAVREKLGDDVVASVLDIARFLALQLPVRPELARELRAIEGRGQRRGGAPPGEDLEHIAFKRANVQKKLMSALLFAYGKKIESHLKLIYSAIDQFAEKVGTLIPLGEKLTNLRAVLAQLENVGLDRPSVHLSLVGYYSDARHKEIKDRITGVLKMIITYTEILMQDDAYAAAGPHIRALRDALKSMIETVDKYSDDISTRLGRAEGRGMDVIGGYGDAEADGDRFGGAVADVKRGFTFEIGSEMGRWPEAFQLVRRSAKRFSDSLRMFNYKYKVAEMKKNLERMTTAFKAEMVDYEGVLARAVGLRMNELREMRNVTTGKAESPIAAELKATAAGDDGAGQLMMFPDAAARDGAGDVADVSLMAVVEPNNSGDIAAVRAAPGKYAELFEWCYNAIENFWKVVQAVDIYLKIFTDGLVNSRADITGIKQMIDEVELISDWYSEQFGDELCDLYEMHANAMDAPLNGLQYGAVVSRRLRRKYVEPSTGGTSSAAEHYFKRVEVSGDGFPAPPFVPLSAGKLGTGLENPAKKCSNLFTKFAALKNLLSFFMHFGNKFANEDIHKRVFLTPTQIYNGLIYFIGVSAYLVGMNNEAKTAMNYSAGKGVVEYETGVDRNVAFAKRDYRSGAVVGYHANHMSAVIMRPTHIVFPAGVDAFSATKLGIDLEIEIFTEIIKAMSAKVLTVSGLYDLFDRPHEKKERNLAVRMIVGAGEDDVIPKIEVGATELYLRLPLMALFYKRNFMDGAPNADGDFVKPRSNVRFLPDIQSGPFSKFLHLVFRKFPHFESSFFTNDEVKQIIREINIIYQKLAPKYPKDTIREIILEMVQTVTKMIYIIDEDTRDTYERVFGFDYEYSKPDIEESELDAGDISILPEEDLTFGNIQRPSPAETSGYVSATQPALPAPIGSVAVGERKVKRGHYALLRQFRRKLDKALSGVVDISLTENVVAAANRLKKETSDEERFRIVCGLLRGGGAATYLDKVRYLMFSETVVTGLDMLGGIYSILRHAQLAIACASPLILYDAVEALTEAKHVCGSNTEVRNAIAEVIARDHDVVGGDAEFVRETLGFTMGFHSVGGGQKFSVVNESGTVQDVDIKLTAAGKISIGATEVVPKENKDWVIQYLGHYPACMTVIMETVSALVSKSHQLIAMNLEGRNLIVDFGSMQDFLNKMLATISGALDLLRPHIDPARTKKYVSKEVVGSFYWMQEQIVERLIHGRPGRNVEGKRLHEYRTLTRLTHDIKNAINRLIMPITSTVAGAPLGKDLRAVIDYSKQFGPLVCFDPEDKYNSGLDPSLKQDALGDAASSTYLKPNMQDSFYQLLVHGFGQEKTIDTRFLYSLRMTRDDNAFEDQNNSIMLAFNKLIAMYLHQFYDTSSGKIYAGLLSQFAQGAFNKYIMDQRMTFPDSLPYYFIDNPGLRQSRQADKPIGGTNLQIRIAKELEECDKWLNMLTFGGATARMLLGTRDDGLIISEPMPDISARRFDFAARPTREEFNTNTNYGANTAAAAAAALIGRWFAAGNPPINVAGIGATSPYFQRVLNNAHTLDAFSDTVKRYETNPVPANISGVIDVPVLVGGTANTDCNTLATQIRAATPNTNPGDCPAMLSLIIIACQYVYRVVRDTYNNELWNLGDSTAIAQALVANVQNAANNPIGDGLARTATAGDGAMHAVILSNRGAQHQVILLATLVPLVKVINATVAANVHNLIPNIIITINNIRVTCGIDIPILPADADSHLGIQSGGPLTQVANLASPLGRAHKYQLSLAAAWLANNTTSAGIGDLLNSFADVNAVNGRHRGDNANAGRDTCTFASPGTYHLMETLDDWAWAGISDEKKNEFRDKYPYMSILIGSGARTRVMRHLTGRYLDMVYFHGNRDGPISMSRESDVYTYNTMATLNAAPGGTVQPPLVGLMCDMFNGIRRTKKAKLGLFDSPTLTGAAGSALRPLIRDLEDPVFITFVRSFLVKNGINLSNQTQMPRLMYNILPAFAISALHETRTVRQCASEYWATLVGMARNTLAADLMNVWTDGSEFDPIIAGSGNNLRTNVGTIIAPISGAATAPVNGIAILGNQAISAARARANLDYFEAIPTVINAWDGYVKELLDVGLQAAAGAAMPRVHRANSYYDAVYDGDTDRAYLTRIILNPVRMGLLIYITRLLAQLHILSVQYRCTAYAIQQSGDRVAESDIVARAYWHEFAGPILGAASESLSKLTGAEIEAGSMIFDGFMPSDASARFDISRLFGMIVSKQGATKTNKSAYIQIRPYLTIDTSAALQLTEMKRRVSETSTDLGAPTQVSNAESASQAAGTGSIQSAAIRTSLAGGRMVVTNAAGVPRGYNNAPQGVQDVVNWVNTALQDGSIWTAITEAHRELDDAFQRHVNTIFRLKMSSVSYSIPAEMNIKHIITLKEFSDALDVDAITIGDGKFISYAPKISNVDTAQDEARERITSYHVGLYPSANRRASDLIPTMPSHERFGERDLPDGNHVLFGTLSYMMHNIITSRDERTRVPVFLLESVAEVPAYMREKYRALLPQFKAALTALVDKSELYKQFIQMFGANFKEPIAGGTRDERAGYKYDGKLIKDRLIGILTTVANGSAALIADCDRVLREIGDDPHFFETYQNSYKDYKAVAGADPIMPISALPYIFARQDKADIAPPIGHIANVLSLNSNFGEPEFKFQYGIRGLIGGRELGPESLYGLTSTLRIFDQFSHNRVKTDPVQMGNYAKLLARGFAFAHDIMRTKRLIAPIRLWRVKNTGAEPVDKGDMALNPIVRSVRANCQQLRGNIAWNHVMYPLGHFEPSTAAEHVAGHTFPLSYSADSTKEAVISDIIGIVENRNREAAIRAVVKPLIDPNESQSDWVLANILDLNIIPFDIHILARQMPLHFIHNYAYTFDHLVVDTLMPGVNPGKFLEEHDEKKALTSARDAMLTLLLEPDRPLTEGDRLHVINMFRGATGIPDLARPKFLSDQLHGKLLFGDLWTLAGEKGPAEIGPMSNPEIVRKILDVIANAVSGNALGSRNKIDLSVFAANTPNLHPEYASTYLSRTLASFIERYIQYTNKMPPDDNDHGLLAWIRGIISICGSLTVFCPHFTQIPSNIANFLVLAASNYLFEKHKSNAINRGTATAVNLSDVAFGKAVGVSVAFDDIISALEANMRDTPLYLESAQSFTNLGGDANAAAPYKATESPKVWTAIWQRYGEDIRRLAAEYKMFTESRDAAIAAVTESPALGTYAGSILEALRAIVNNSGDNVLGGPTLAAIEAGQQIADPSGILTDNAVVIASTWAAANAPGAATLAQYKASIMDHVNQVTGNRPGNLSNAIDAIMRIVGNGIEAQRAAVNAAAGNFNVAIAFDTGSAVQTRVRTALQGAGYSASAQNIVVRNGLIIDAAVAGGGNAVIGNRGPYIVAYAAVGGVNALDKQIDNQAAGNGTSLAAGANPAATAAGLNAVGAPILNSVIQLLSGAARNATLTAAIRKYNEGASGERFPDPVDVRPGTRVPTEPYSPSRGVYLNSAPADSVDSMLGIYTNPANAKPTLVELQSLSPATKSAIQEAKRNFHRMMNDYNITTLGHWLFGKSTSSAPALEYSPLIPIYFQISQGPAQAAPAAALSLSEMAKDNIGHFAWREALEIALRDRPIGTEPTIDPRVWSSATVGAVASNIDARIAAINTQSQYMGRPDDDREFHGKVRIAYRLPSKDEYIPPDPESESGANFANVSAVAKKIGLMRLDTLLVRNLIFITNAERILRLRLHRDLTYNRDRVAKSLGVLSSDIHEFYGNQTLPPPGSKYVDNDPRFRRYI